MAARPLRLLPTRALAWTAIAVLHSTARAQGSVELQAPDDERFSVHLQATVATKRHPSFHASYSGQDSLQPIAESATSVVLDLFTGARLWRGAEVHFQPELRGGRGLSSTLGVAAFPSGEIYRVGDPTPNFALGRLFLRPTVELGCGATCVEPGPNQLAGTRDRNALTITLDKLATSDFVDRNPFASDPHTQFMTWGLRASAAYDQPILHPGYNSDRGPVHVFTGRVHVAF